MLITAPAADDDDEDQFKPMPKGPGTKKVIISLGHKKYIPYYDLDPLGI